ncbi:hypothetical protein BGZ92_006566, partial [Podila epicladia]
MATGKFRAVFLAPELIFSSERISRIWEQAGWRDRLFAVVVDEAHCIDSWGPNFRQDYARIGQLRCKVPRKTPFLAVSATLPPQILQSIKTSLLCRPDTLVINVGNDRPNIKLIVAQLQHPLNSFQDLKFLLDFKKTIVYFEKRPDAELARQYLLGQLDDPTDRSKIAVYHSVKSDFFKQHILERFRNDKVLVLLATEAV